MPASRLVPAYVAVGSNLDDPRAQVERALSALAELPQTRLVLCSSLYWSRPLGPVEQPDFVNAVAGLLTGLDPAALLAVLKDLEVRLGRAQPVVRWGPRRIDLDLLVHGTARSDADALRLPHPGIAERAFVLVPLAEIAPDLDVPGRGRVRDLLARVDAASLERIAA
ncbi:MAG: 2-amino-4-hydroxy-6-hydroxymethyldihydropteridine diphosphokinase [Gammaproteobacteria bacterium]|jgi:2-amino-4-hydroxy-6-hydroxymethyldihydropteridine diphosphokinase|nr:2-amino-4-hydroxy-6-hydroxymethyldihydropteridine diphosphokinase [Gammaproteobacteria bacterium]